MAEIEKLSWKSFLLGMSLLIPVSIVQFFVARSQELLHTLSSEC